MLTSTSFVFITLCLYAGFNVIECASVYQMNQDIKQGRAPSTIKRIDPANPELYDRLIHAHFTDGSTLYTNGEWKHSYKQLTNAEKTWLRANGWNI